MHLNPLPLDPRDKVCRHVDAIFGAGVSDALPAAGNDDDDDGMGFEFSRKTGRIKNFSISGKLIATLRTDGGLALTVAGAQFLASSRSGKPFKENCVVPVQDAVPFVTEGRSLFCRHVDRCGANVKAGSDVAIITVPNDGSDSYTVIAVGIAVLGFSQMGRYNRGVAVKVREGLKSRTT